MLHRTQLHNPFLFTPRIQGMEFAEAAEDLGGVNGGGGPGDDFFVDGLLDFSNGFSESEVPPEEPLENKKAGDGCDAPPPPENLSLSVGGDFGSLHETELSVQGESLESLEWLSHFVEDSFPDYSLAGKISPPGPAANRSQAPALEEGQQRFVSPVQTKARTKRARTGLLTRPVLSPSSSSSSTTAPFPPLKKHKRKLDDSGGGGAHAPPRRCTHCGVTKTPQWRAGPFGPKTLCNACGVRHKSGRLLPEYRPACSPTFSTELHSNNHRKVMEMRRKKGTEGGAGSELLV